MESLFAALVLVGFIVCVIGSIYSGNNPEDPWVKAGLGVSYSASLILALVVLI